MHGPPTGACCSDAAGRSANSFTEDSCVLAYSVLVMHAAVQQIPPQISMAAAREEAEMVLFDSVRNVLEEAHLKPGQVSFLESDHKCTSSF